MFEAAELGRKVPKRIFAQEEPQVHAALLNAQQKIRTAKIPAIVIVSGVEGAGKGEVVNRLNKWLDPRGVRTYAFWDQTDEETLRPRFWRFWRRLPPGGTIGIMFGSWYTQPIIDRVFEHVDQAGFEHELRRIEAFERLLVVDGAMIVKFWFHLSKEDQHKRLRADLKHGRMSSPLLKKFSKRYDTFARVSERAIRMTDTGACPWYLIESSDWHYRDLTVGQTLLHAIEARLHNEVTIAPAGTPHHQVNSVGSIASATILDQIDLTAKLTQKVYEKQLELYQRQLHNLAWKAREHKRHSVAVFEGWDAAGKGSTIRRVTQAVDARLYQVISIAGPTDEELAHHYLWRFWRHIPRAGYMTIYDRSWYGRVLVERVEGFAREDEWKRAYQEINDFEEQLVEHGVVLLKFWLHISSEEQLHRFQERQEIDRKQHKITEEDWRNREKWEDYRAAVNDMVIHTSTAGAPWNLIPANDKKFARVEVMKTFCNRLEHALRHGA